jgi:acyl-coenzyme A synthetase/AMP-(fatty) acid ligase
VAAVVVLREAVAATEEELFAYVAGQLAHYKVPTRWTLTTTPLPRNATGKVNRHEVVGQR